MSPSGLSTRFWTFVAWFFRGLFSLRYKVSVQGLQQLDALEEKKGLLFLPNHPAHLDPLFVCLALWPRYRMRPLVVEYILRLSWMRFWMRLVRALPIPNFETSINQVKVKRAEASIQEIAKGLKQGENFLLYPSGRLKGGAREVLGGASALHSLLQECPTAKVILIRTTGLWGSSFSKAITGRSPDPGLTFLKGLSILFKNGLFFTPRRSVLIEVEIAPPDLPKDKERLDLNRYLEAWYNRYPVQGKRLAEEPLQLVSYRFYRKQFPEAYCLTHPKKEEGGSGAPILPEIQEKVFKEIQEILEKPDLVIRPEMHLAFDLGMDSLQIAELMSYVGVQFQVDELHPEDLETVESILEVASGARKAEPPLHQVVRPTWSQERGRLPPRLAEGTTIPEAFFHSCDRMGFSIACGDDLVGELSYRQLKRAVLVLAQEFQRYPQERIGVLLPASIGTFVAVLALQCAGKVPVMLNWTLGPLALDEMVKLSGTKQVVSSWRFLERLSYVDFGSLTDQIIQLEDIREAISLKTKLKGLFLSYLRAKALLRSLPLPRSEENLAVILFTSGTEATPKGVPLSHRNILTNLRSGIQCIDLKASDVLYAILPPFHSFGFSVAGLFAFLSGLKVAFYPDPTDSFALAEGIARWEITLLCSAPSFLKGLFQAAKKEQLATLRLLIAGAEKLPQELRGRLKELHREAKLIEGYGITECSPILTLCRPYKECVGVGELVPGIEACTIHPETLELLGSGKEGEICVRGPNVFAGYLDAVPSPFITLKGQKWYRTGDLGYLDPAGNLILSGRLKRFAKIGGEMISLGAIEEVLTRELIARQWISADHRALAVGMQDRQDGKPPQLILFCTIPVGVEEVNDLLHQRGFSRLVKISTVQAVNEIPLLATGKTDYRRLWHLS